MKFKELEEGKLYQDRDNANVYAIVEGLLYQLGYLLDGKLNLEMYYAQYTPSYMLNMNFKEIELSKCIEHLTPSNLR